LAESDYLPVIVLRACPARRLETCNKPTENTQMKHRSLAPLFPCIPLLDLGLREQHVVNALWKDAAKWTGRCQKLLQIAGPQEPNLAAAPCFSICDSFVKSAGSESNAIFHVSAQSQSRLPDHTRGCLQDSVRIWIAIQNIANSVR